MKGESVGAREREREEKREKECGQTHTSPTLSIASLCTRYFTPLCWTGVHSNSHSLSLCSLHFFLLLLSSAAPAVSFLLFTTPINSQKHKKNRPQSHLISSYLLLTLSIHISSDYFVPSSLSSPSVVLSSSATYEPVHHCFHLTHSNSNHPLPFSFSILPTNQLVRSFT